ncbi:MAG TPA: bacillithiol biosynthesis cysteine-adding enzyme BshC [Bacteroidota bacterium]|jgi:bacillithiol biosynthesis cysteine-adding enzyme BshC
MSESQWIDFGALPHSEGGFSKLFGDYVNEFPKVRSFFEADFHFIHNFPKHAELLGGQAKHRSEVADILLDQNRQIGASEKTLENIGLLRDSKTFAIVTGQQVGILGGPLYTVYKTITALRLAEQLSATFSDYKFVPVFWLEGEDHDLEEVNSVSVLNGDHSPVEIDYPVKGKPAQKNAGAVGDIEFDGSLDQFFDRLQKTLPNSEFKEPLFSILKQAYAPASTFTSAFARLMNGLFEGSGLVFISSNDRRLKQLLKPIFLKEIEEYPRVSQLIIQRSAELEGRYHAQIKTKAMNLFMFFKGGRYFIEPREKEFGLRGIRQYFQRDELLNIVNQTPELLSPNVALRPICQDTLLPTLAYVGGPAEIAYFAQLKTVYAHFGMTMPIIYPRASVTIYEQKFERILEKYQLELLEFFGDSERVTRKVVELISEVKIEEMFDDAVRRSNELMAEMKYGLNYIDSTLMGPLETTRSKTESHLLLLKEKVVEAQERKHEIALRQVRKVSQSITPNAMLQERVLNFTYFMNKYGPEFIKRLTSDIEIDRFKHQVLSV